MNEWVWIIILGAVGYVFIGWGIRWWRNRRAAKLADELLADVLKGKDAFRR